MQSKYTTKENVIARVTTTLTDPEVESIISLVSGYMDTFLGYKLATDYSETPIDMLLDGSGTEYLMLSQPIYAYTGVEAVALDDSVNSVNYTVSYPLNASYTGYLGLKIGKFISGMANYKIKGAKLGRFTVDWTTPSNHTLDESITEVCTSICVAMINAGGAVMATSGGETEKSGKVTGETIGSYSVQYANNPASQRQLISSVPTATDILDKYKIIQIA